jgi:hypothetical protein
MLHASASVRLMAGDTLPAAPTTSTLSRIGPQKIMVSGGRCLICFSDPQATLQVMIGSIENADPVLAMRGGMAGTRTPPWQFGHGYLWSDVDIGIANFLYRYKSAFLFKGRLAWGDDGVEDKTVVFLPNCGPLNFIHNMGLASEFPRKVLSTYYPMSEDRLLLFVLTNIPGRIVAKPGGTAGQTEYTAKYTKEQLKTPRWSFSLYQISLKLDSRKELVEDLSFSIVDSLEAQFIEPFQVVAQGKVYFFVTSSGKLYRTGARRILTDRRMVDPVWDDDARPITHFITDADTDRTFVFCKPAKKDELGVYFELGPKPDPKPYDLSKVKPAKANEPLKSALERARWLADQKLLKNQDPPREEKKR